MIDDGHDLADPPAAQATTGIDQDGAAHAGSGRDTGQGDHRPGAVPLVEVGAPLGHEHAPLSPALLLTAADDVGVEAVFVPRGDRCEDAGQVRQGQARRRLTPGGQGASGAGAQDHQEIVSRSAGASGYLMGAFHDRTGTFRSCGGAQSLHAFRLEGEASGGVVQGRASCRATRPRPRARCPIRPMSSAASTPRFAPDQVPSRPPSGPSR